ncbi:MAG TPA: sodium:solute symporter [Candidatus Acidoferrales bacterium]|nr:sodium:solute symporter [Candidatus Acidoferrales bacterium]
MRISGIDFGILAAYLAAVTLFGLRFRRGQTSLREYFLSSRSAPWWALAGSIVATETSTLTIISTPGLAYAGDLGFLQIVIGYLVARVVICLIFIPQYFRGEYFTAYQLIEKRFGERMKSAAATVFLVTRALAEGVRINAIGKVVSVAFGTGERLSVAVMTLLVIVYTYAGGMRAVIWTDFAQLVLYIGGSVVAFFLLLHRIPGGWGEVARLAAPGHKLQVFHFHFSLTQPYTFWAGVIGGTFLTMASHGTDQTMVQRLLAARSERESKAALLASGVIVFVQFALFLVIGVMLYAFARHTGLLPPGGDTDRLFPEFIVRDMPAGLAGLMLAAIFAVAMSNASGSLNSLASSSMVDFKRLRRGRALDDARLVGVSRWVTVGWGVVLGLLGLLHWGVVLVAGLTIASITYGGLLGLFLLGVADRRATPRGALAGMLAGLAVMVMVQFARPIAAFAGIALQGTIAWTWYVLVGTIVTFATGWLVSRLAPGAPASGGEPR